MALELDGSNVRLGSGDIDHLVLIRIIERKPSLPTVRKIPGQFRLADQRLLFVHLAARQITEVISRNKEEEFGRIYRQPPKQGFKPGRDESSLPD